MANNAVLRNNAPIQSVGHFLPPVGVNTWDGSRRLQLGRINRLIGSNITLNTTNNTILLQPGTYKLTACWQIGFATGQATIKWYNETTASFFGQDLFIPTVDNNSNWNTSNILIETITVTSATSVSIRDTGSGTTQPTETRSYVIVEQLFNIVNNQSNMSIATVSNGGSLTFNNLVITATTTGGAGILLATTSGTINVDASGYTQYGATSIYGSNKVNTTITTTAQSLMGWNGTGAQNSALIYLRDLTNTRLYKIELMTGTTTHILIVTQLI
jgi:hypothetical protein